MRVLVACEFSGVVREAFRKRGHDAYSCDLIPSDDNSKYHIQGDVLEILEDGWDLMIAHPPCTYLCSSGLHWNKRVPGRDLLTNESVDFCKKIMSANIPKIVMENPIGRLSTAYKKPDQIIQPWQFGHPESKATCFWLKGLPKLKPTEDVKEVWKSLPKNQAQRLHYLSPGPERAKLRSKTFSGIARAMAQQWGSYVYENRKKNFSA